MSAGEFSGIGFAAGVVTGVRSFDVDKLGRLTGVSYKDIWTPGENSATCRLRNDEYAMTIAQMQQMIAKISYEYGTGGMFGRKKSPAPIPASNPAPDHSKPHDMAKCSHGFYAYYDGSNDYKSDARISGVVEGYGEVVIGTRGFRAMKARIVALRINKEVPENVASMVRRNYPTVPFFDSFKAMVAEFPPDDAGNGISPESDPDFWTRSI